ncbi:hypothetical protein COOONC_18549 [Cooperia oncophora]
MSSRKREDFKWLFKIHHICTVFLYAIFQLSLFLNLYVLLSREDTIFYLRIYHSIIALLMFCCGIIEIEFLIRTRKLEKLEEPHEIPTPALIGTCSLLLFVTNWRKERSLFFPGAVALTIGIVS